MFSWFSGVHAISDLLILVKAILIGFPESKAIVASIDIQTNKIEIKGNMVFTQLRFNLKWEHLLILFAEDEIKTES